MRYRKAYWKVTNIERNSATIAYGPISFDIEIFADTTGKILITKPSSFFVDGPDFKDMLAAVRRKYIQVFAD